MGPRNVCRMIEPLERIPWTCALVTTRGRKEEEESGEIAL
jgi:hypothetical protein